MISPDHVSGSPAAGLKVHVGPARAPEIVAAVHESGAVVTGLDDADAVVWTGSPATFPAGPLPSKITWVQLPSAGVETWIARGVIDGQRLWTSAAGAYAATVAEHALSLLLAGVRGLPHLLGRRSWDRDSAFPSVGTVRGAQVAVIGAGGVGRVLLRLLAGLGAETVAVNRSGAVVPEAGRTVPFADVATVWPLVDHVILAAPATPSTRHMVGAAQLAALKPRSWLVNVGRGEVVDTDALVRALRDGVIAGACLDVVEPEPLPDTHPLWSEPRAMITPHVANPPDHLRQAFAEHVARNVRRRLSGQELLGRVDLEEGY